MDELTIQTLIKAKYSGSYTEMSMYLSLTLQAVAVMIGGIVLWRMSVMLHKRKQAQRKRNSFFETTYSKNWRK
jgi:hypothetical protein